MVKGIMPVRTVSVYTMGEKNIKVYSSGQEREKCGNATGEIILKPGLILIEISLTLTALIMTVLFFVF